MRYYSGHKPSISYRVNRWVVVVAVAMLTIACSQEATPLPPPTSSPGVTITPAGPVTPAVTPTGPPETSTLPIPAPAGASTATPTPAVVATPIPLPTSVATPVPTVTPSATPTVTPEPTPTKKIYPTREPIIKRALRISGTVYLSNGDVTNVTFDPLSEGSTTISRLSSTGDYRLQLVGNNGAELTGTEFDLTGYIQDYGITDYGMSPPPPFFSGEGHFSVSILHPNEPIASVALRHKGWLIAEVKASVHVPEVTIVRPVGGEIFIDSDVPIEWVGTDVDGGPLAYDVYYSLDDGRFWSRLTYRSIRRTSFEAPFHEFRSGKKGKKALKIKVLVTDGVNINSAVSNEFTLVGTPRIFPILPKHGDTLLVSEENLFWADVYDLDDRYLEDSALTWTSSMDGLLGTGVRLRVSPNTLTVGAHEITATATDPDGNSATWRITIQVIPE